MIRPTPLPDNADAVADASRTETIEKCLGVRAAEAYRGYRLLGLNPIDAHVAAVDEHYQSKRSGSGRVV